MKELSIFDYKGNQVRTIQKDGETWWVLKDVCEILKLSSPHKVFERLDDDERGRNQIPTLGGTQNMAIINESGLYSVILRSDKAEAKPFRKWVTGEVLPSIRRTGGYGRQDAALLRLTEHVEKLTEMVMELYSKKKEEPQQIAIQWGRDTYSARDLLKYHGIGMSIIEFNQMMEEKGYLEEIHLRALRQGKDRKCKILTEKGLPYGENRRNIRCNTGHQPGYYADSFLVLYKKVTEE